MASLPQQRIPYVIDRGSTPTAICPKYKNESVLGGVQASSCHPNLNDGRPMECGIRRTLRALVQATDVNLYHKAGHHL